MKKIISILLVLTLSLTMAVGGFADNAYFTSRFGVSMSKAEYDELLSQGLSEEDIDYLDFDAFNTYMSEAGGELISRTDIYYIAKADGNNIEVSKSEAEALAQSVNQGIMPMEDFGNGYDSDNDGVCHLALGVYGLSNGRLRHSATVTWLTDPSVNREDILGIGYNTALVTLPGTLTAKMWYDFSVDGLNYDTTGGNAASTEISSDGCGVVCSFARTVNHWAYPVPCKDFRYQVEVRTEKNSDSMKYAFIQANFYRGIYALDVSLDLDLMAVLAVVAGVTSSPFPLLLSLVPSIRSDFAQPLQANILYQVNI